MAKTKRCKGTCGKTRPLSAFGRDASKPDGLNRSCRPCFNAYSAERARRRRADSKEPGAPAGAMVQRQDPVERYLDGHALSCAVQAART